MNLGNRCSPKRPARRRKLDTRFPGRDDLIRRTEQTIEEQLEGMLHIKAVGDSGPLEELLTERYRQNLRAAAEMVYELYIPF